MVVLQLAMSLDGFIARKDGSVDFLGEMDETVTEMFQSFISRIDTIVMGRTSYDQMLSFGEVGFTDKRIIVLSSKELSKTYPHVERQSTDVVSLMNSLSGNTWLFGGANVIKQCLKNNVVDRFELFIVPHILGDGIPLFEDIPELSELHLLQSEQYGDNVLLVYENTSNR